MVARSEKQTSVVTDGDAAMTTTWRARLWRYVPLVAWIGVVFFASTGNLSASNTSRIIRPLLIWLFPDITESSLLYAHFLVRKAAHLTEYALLALLAARAFLGSSRTLLRVRWYVFAFVLASSCALLDEYHQSFLPSRTGTPYDSLLDMTGSAVALLLLTLRRWQRRRKSA